MIDSKNIRRPLPKRGDSVLEYGPKGLKGLKGLPAFLLLAELVLALTLGGCFMEGGTEIPNELTGKERVAEGGAAANARVDLYPVSYVPGDTASGSPSAPVYTATTDGSGKFAVKDVPAGRYNITVTMDDLKSFRDSVTVTGKAQHLGEDTLRQPGTLVGKVELQPNHSPQTAVVQAFGTSVFVNVDKDGRFEMAGLGAGTYRLRAASSLEGYTPAFKVVEVRAGQKDSLAEPIRPFYSKTPVVTGITAKAGPNGTVIITWNKSSYANLDGYLIYRDPADAPVPSGAILVRTSDTLWIDTVYSRTPRAGQYPFEDTTYHPMVYRVRILDKSTETGPVFHSAQATAVPPAIKFVSGQWKRAFDKAPFGARWNHDLLVFKDRLWMFGAQFAPDTAAELWSSADGLAWKRELAALPFLGGTAFTVFQDKLWAIAGGSTPGTFEPGPKNRIYKSEDGLAWTPVTDAPAFPGVLDPEFLVHGGKLFLLSGYRNSGNFTYYSDVWSSADGASWAQVNTDPAYFATGTALSFAGRIWGLGGGFMFATEQVRSILSSPDGVSFAEHPAPAGLLPRTQSGAAVHAGRMWILSGLELRTGGDVKLDDFWSSEDGLNWILVDAHSPAGYRTRPAMASFKGKLWVSGGIGPTEPLADLWYFEGP